MAGVRESAVSAKRGWVSLARNRRSPKRPCEPRPSGVHPEEGAVEEKARSHLGTMRPLVNRAGRSLGANETSSTRQNWSGRERIQR